jgi:hypothetical protein
LIGLKEKFLAEGKNKMQMINCEKLDNKETKRSLKHNLKFAPSNRQKQNFSTLSKK